MTSSRITSLAIDRKWPTSWDAMCREWTRRREVYRGGEYSGDDFERLFLFAGTNAADQVVIKTRRISTMCAFLADVDAACVGAPLSLGVATTAFAPTLDANGVEVTSTAEKDALAQGQEIIRRCAVEDLNEEWARTLSSEGDLYVEVALDDAGLGTFYALANGTCRIYGDKFNRRIDRAVICFEYTVDGDTTPTKYKREITAAKIKTTDGDRPTEEKDNPLGVVTVLHVPFRPVPGSRGFSKNAFGDVEDVCARADSASSQMSAIGTKLADPILATKGFAITPGGDESQGGQGMGSPSSVVGKTLPMQREDDAHYISVDLTGAAAVNDAAKAGIEQAMATQPEYLFTQSGANSSGLAMSYMATALVAKLEPPQRRYRAMLARAIGMCRALDMRVKWSDAMDIYVMGGAPVLPMDKGAELDMILKAREGGLLKTSDAIKAAQGLGIVDPEEDPAEYAEEVKAEQAALDASAAAMLDRMAGRTPAETAPSVPS